MKLKYSICDKLNICSKCEQKLLLYMARYQDDSTGTIEGVYYKDVVNAEEMCEQSFYNAIKGLEEKGIIEITRASKIDYDVHIIGNEFPDKQSYTDGYVNLNRKVFRSSAFNSLKAHELYMLMQFLKGTHENGHSMQIGTQKLYQKFKDILGVTDRVIRGYLHTLKKFFSIGIKDGKYFITYLHSVFHDRNDKSEEKQMFEHLVNKECRRNHIAYDRPDFDETVTFISQHRGQVSGTAEVIDLLMQSIRKSVEGIKRKDRTLKKKYVHKLLVEAIQQL